MKISKKGISLIVLIITIIVIIILATAIIISLNDNNIINDSDKARYESDRANMQALLTTTISKIAVENLGTVKIHAAQINTVTSKENQVIGKLSYTVKSRVNTANTNGTIIFDKGENTATIYYTGKKLPIYAAGETKWYVDSEGVISLKVAGVKYGNGEPFAVSVAADPISYYGKIVTNYETGNSTIDSQVKWQIFHSDGNNIYLIATDYIAGSLAPSGRKNTSINFSDKHIWFEDVTADYDGCEDITDSVLKALNSKYYEYLRINSITTLQDDINMKPVAYMMDTSEAVWGKFAGENAAYAIGGPTLELFLDSYNAKKGTTYKCNVDSVTGYKVSIDNGSTWATSFDGLDTTDSQYIILSDVDSSDEVRAMWLASTPAHASSLLRVSFYGQIGLSSYNYNAKFGLRPVVCLNSDVALEAVEGGFAIK